MTHTPAPPPANPIELSEFVEEAKSACNDGRATDYPSYLVAPEKLLTLIESHAQQAQRIAELDQVVDASEQLLREYKYANLQEGSCAPEHNFFGAIDALYNAVKAVRP